MFWNLSRRDRTVDSLPSVLLCASFSTSCDDTSDLCTKAQTQKSTIHIGHMLLRAFLALFPFIFHCSCFALQIAVGAVSICCAHKASAYPRGQRGRPWPLPSNHLCRQRAQSGAEERWHRGGGRKGIECSEERHRARKERAQRSGRRVGLC